MSFNRISGRTGLSLLLAAALTACHRPFTPVELRCEYLTDPLVVESGSPRLSWVNAPASSSVKEQRQMAWQVLVATSREKLTERKADVWNSGRRMSEESFLVPYAGAALTPMTTYYWKVRTWDASGKASSWSRPARWGTGPARDGWEAQWIGAPWQEDVRGNWYTRYPMFRKAFSVGPDLKEAKVYICGLGWFELSLNGEKAGDDFFVPGFTDYTRRPFLEESRQIPISPDVTSHQCLYMGYDITSLLHRGDNVVGVLLGNGYFHTAPTGQVRRQGESFGTPRLICRIELTYKDGHHEHICSDASWQCAPSPIVFGDLWEGEVYDAREEDENWNKAGTPGPAWTAAVPVAAPHGPLKAQSGPVDKVCESLRPCSLLRQEDGSWRVDFGKVISGWVRLKDVRGSAGDTLRVRFEGEYPSPRCEYVFASDKPVTFAPRFTWYVFREAVVSGVERLRPDQIVAEAVCSDVPVLADFRSSEPMLRQILDLFLQAQKDNMHAGVASDCPHRERLPYTGDGQVAMAAVMDFFSADAFYNKWIQDILASQHPASGYVPNGAPWEPMCGGGVPWGAAICVMPWEFYLHTGDRKLLRDSLEGMKGYLRYLSDWERPDGTILSQRTLPDGTPCRWYNLGDWSPAFDLPDPGLVHTFYYWYCASIAAQSAEALGEREDAEAFRERAERIREAFHRVFYDAQRCSYGDCGGNVFALFMGGLPSERLDAVRQSLRDELENKYRGHLNTGFVATRFLFETLALNGMNDLAFTIMTQRDFPGYGWFLEQGATTLWEYWDGRHSHCHPMFGGGLTWLSRVLSGVRTDPAEPGFRHVVIRPVPVPGLDDVLYAAPTPYGRVSSHYSCREGRVSLDVEVPVGCRATVFVPRDASTASRRPWDDAAYDKHELSSGRWHLCGRSYIENQ